MGHFNRYFSETKSYPKESGSHHNGLNDHLFQRNKVYFSS